MIDRNEKCYIIGTDGTLRYMPAYLIPDLQKKGWRLVSNPKRTYYAEFDQTNPNWKSPDEPEQEIDTLKVEVV